MNELQTSDLSDLDSFEIPKYTNLIEEEILRNGYIHIRDKMIEKDYQSISESLGFLMSKSELKLDPKKDKAQEQRRKYWTEDDARPSIYKHFALDFHTDNPRQNRISWYCIRQDEKFGALLLIDSRNILADFTSVEKEVLKSIRLRYIMIEGGNEYHPWEPLLTIKDGQEEIYFAEWHLKDAYTKEQLALIDRFKRGLEREKESGTIAVRLEPGESIYVDNRRMLHARGPISEDSKRHIIRLAMCSKWHL
ncbi:MAG: TauD/TfdA family dioxygenase [Saprospiraceae bacterium]|nr:TauD/TfdA family dioxygenase [Saprospiraceae bacterium]